MSFHLATLFGHFCHQKSRSLPVSYSSLSAIFVGCRFSLISSCSLPAAHIRKHLESSAVLHSAWCSGTNTTLKQHHSFYIWAKMKRNVPPEHVVKYGTQRAKNRSKWYLASFIMASSVVCVCARALDQKTYMYLYMLNCSSSLLLWSLSALLYQDGGNKVLR